MLKVFIIVYNRLFLHTYYNTMTILSSLEQCLIVPVTLPEKYGSSHNNRRILKYFLVQHLYLFWLYCQTACAFVVPEDEPVSAIVTVKFHNMKNYRAAAKFSTSRNSHCVILLVKFLVQSASFFFESSFCTKEELYSPTVFTWRK